MAQITITISDDQMPRVVAGLCAAGGVSASEDAAQQVVFDWISSTVQNAERQAAILALEDPPPVVIDPGPDAAPGS
jgi:hypothetical protein